MEKFCNIFWSLWKNFSSINYLLVVTKIMKLLVNVLTPSDKYSILSFSRKQFKFNYL